MIYITGDKHCGHWHTDKVVEKIRFMFNDFVELGK